MANDEETVAVYPSEDGPVPTPRYEGVREGVDDMRYVFTLREAIKDGLGSGDRAREAAARRAAQQLEELVSQISIDGRGDMWGEDLDRTRRKVARLIVKLR